MVDFLKALQREHVVSIKEIQKSPSKSLRGITRILRGSKTFGYFLDEAALDNLIEDLEALSSPAYLKRIAQARRSKRHYSLADVKQRYGL